MTGPLEAVISILMLLAPALIGMASNRLRPLWGLLLLPLYLLAFTVVITCDHLYRSGYPVGQLTVNDVTNSAVFMLFPLILINGPPFLVGRYVPQVMAFVRRRFSSKRTKSA